MRHLKFMLLSTLSVVSFMAAASPAGAFSLKPDFLFSNKDLGHFKPLSYWDVGKVNTKSGDTYCAMVNKYEKGAVLAISRNATGQGSAAIDIKKDYFKTGTEYSVAVGIDGFPVRRLPAKATSEQALVIQFGGDEKFYEELSSNGKIEFITDQVSFSMGLRAFSDYYGKLVNCSADLANVGPAVEAVPVARVDKQPLSTAGKAAAASAAKSTTAAKETNVPTIELLESKKRIAELEAKYAEQMKTQDALMMAVEVKNKEIAKLTEERKQKEIDAIKQASAQEQALAARVAELQQSRDALQKERDTAKAEMEAAMKAAQETKWIAEQSKTIKDDLSAKQSQMADEVQKQIQKTTELSAALTGAQKDAQAKIDALVAERDGLKKTLETLQVENAPLKFIRDKAEADLTAAQAKIADLEARLDMSGKDRDKLTETIAETEKNYKLLQATLDAKEQELLVAAKDSVSISALKAEKEAIESRVAAADQQRQQMATRLDMQNRQAKILQAALASKEKELATVIANNKSDSKALAELRGEMQALKPEYASVIMDLQNQLKQKIADYDDLKNKLAKANVPAPKMAEGREGETNNTTKRAEDFLNRIMAYHQSGYAKKAAIETPDEEGVPVKSAAELEKLGVPVTLEGVLNNTGVPLDNFTPVTQNEGTLVAEWNAGNINGMFEQKPARGKFADQVKDYMQRYNIDCGPGLKVNMGREKTASAGSTMTADIECTASDDSYVTSFLFLKNDAGFNTIMHTSLPDQKEAVENMRDAIANQLSTAGRFISGQPLKASAESTPMLKFNIKEEPRVAPSKRLSSSSDELETVVIQ